MTLPVRKNPRATWYDYSCGGDYFVTIVCKDRRHYFGFIENGIMILNMLGKVCEKEIIESQILRKNIVIHEYVVMPNHIHLLLSVGTHANASAQIQANTNTSDYIQPHANASVNNTSHTNAFPNHVSKQIGSANHAGYADAFARVPSTKYNPTLSLQGLSSVVRILKSRVTKYANEHKIPFGWQSRYHDSIIRDQNQFDNVKQYIINNPIKRSQDRFH